MKKIILGLASIITIGGAVLVAQTNESTVAEDKPPIVLQVENHEERIGDLEDKTDKTQTQVNQNTADISAIRTQTGTSAADPVEQVVTPIAQPETTSNTPPNNPAPDPDPVPQPTPELDPRLIMAMTDTPGANPALNNHTCSYTLYSQEEDVKQGDVVQPNSMPCYQIGEVLPRY